MSPSAAASKRRIAAGRARWAGATLLLFAVIGGVAPACEIDHRSLVQEPLEEDCGSDEVAGGSGVQERGGAAGKNSGANGGRANAGDSAGEAGSDADSGMSHGAGGTNTGGTNTGGTNTSGMNAGGMNTGGASTGGKSGAGGTSANGGTSSGGKSGTGGTANASAGSSGNASGDGGTSAAGGAFSSGGSATVTCPDLNENSVPDCSETLLKNATFDASAAGAPNDWRVDNSVTTSWDSLDSMTPHSGSVVLTSSSADALGMDQCVPLQSGKNYEAFALMLIQANSSTGFARLSADFYPNTDCSGSYDRVVASAPEGTINSWRTLHVPESPAQSDRSLRIRLELLKAASASSISVHFDSVLLLGNSDSALTR
ncbi:MAG TPA: hypothetical protein VFK05_15830 [Polyangiaceae bacterium]|nr:hypothetical protein [Polyangiaceae bacterium]